MGHLQDGEWVTESLKSKEKDGTFKRPDTIFRNWITADGSAGPTGSGGYKAEAGRYHLYLAWACPWAHRTLLFRKLKGLDDLISVSFVHPDMMDKGWTFATDFPGSDGDPLFGKEYAYEIYQKADPKVTCRVTVPILWDKQTDTIVSNESSEIIRMFNSAFNDLTGNTDDYWPEDLREAIEPVNARIYDTLNNGVYRSGFSTTQSAYDAAVTALFDTMEWLEERLSSNLYLMGDRLTEADWRLFPTLYRFDSVYHLHFKCNRKRVIDYPNLWAYTRELYQMPGISETVNMPQVVRHYHYSHESVNPHRIIPINPILDWDEPHGRDQLKAA